MELVIIDCLIINYLFTISQVSQTPSTTGTPPQYPNSCKTNRLMLYIGFT